jgi:aryl-alcohol dehydrogenase-like predicted oxidoreductase
VAVSAVSDLSDNKSKAECVPVVQQALDLGVNFFDTEESYGTARIIGKRSLQL